MRLRVTAAETRHNTSNMQERWGTRELLGNYRGLSELVTTQAVSQQQARVLCNLPQTSKTPLKEEEAKAGVGKEEAGIEPKAKVDISSLLLSSSSKVSHLIFHEIWS